MKYQFKRNCKNILNEFFIISNRQEFLSLRVNYWGFLLAFSALLIAPNEIISWKPEQYFLIFSAFFGMMLTMLQYLSRLINIKLLAFGFSAIGLIIDTIYLTSLGFVLL